MLAHWLPSRAWLMGELLPAPVGRRNDRHLLSESQKTEQDHPRSVQSEEILVHIV